MFRAPQIERMAQPRAVAIKMRRAACLGAPVVYALLLQAIGELVAPPAPFAAPPVV